MMFSKISTILRIFCLLIILISCAPAYSQTMMVHEADTGAFFNQHELKKISHIIADVRFQEEQINMLAITLVDFQNALDVANEKTLTVQVQLKVARRSAKLLSSKHTVEFDRAKLLIKKLRRQRNKAYVGAAVSVAVIVLIAM